MCFRFEMATARAWLVMVCVVGVSLMLASCAKESREGARLPTYPVEGQITVNGKPGAGIVVELVTDKQFPKTTPRDLTIHPVGLVQADGTFKITTYATEDGAPDATYKIKLTYPVKPGGFSKGVDPIDKLGGKFADAEKNAKNDPEHFTVEVTPQPEGSVITVPKIEITDPGFDDTFKVP